jgi:hypothetical protein
MKQSFLSILLLLSLLGAAVHGFDYNITSAGSIFLTDEKTGISGLLTIFTGDITNVEVQDVEWGFTGLDGGDTDVVWSTIVDGVEQASGTFSLVGTERSLPTSIPVGSVVINKSKLLAFVHVFSLCVCVCVCVCQLFFN